MICDMSLNDMDAIDMSVSDIPDASRRPPLTPQDLFGGYPGKFVRR